MISSSGTNLLDPTALKAYNELIFPLATLVTPNLDEAEAILGSDSIATIESMKDAAAEIHKLGPPYVLVKGGHLSDGEDAVDILYDGDSVKEYRSRKISTKNLHGTGCTHSAAIASGLAAGKSLHDSIVAAKEFISESIENSRKLGSSDLLSGSVYLK